MGVESGGRDDERLSQTRESKQFPGKSCLNRFEEKKKRFGRRKQREGRVRKEL